MKRKRIKRLGIVLSVVLICVVTLLLAPVIGASGATYDTWDKLRGLYLMSGGTMWSLSDITTYNYSGTTNNSKVYSDCSHYFDDIKLDTNSRVTYGRKIRVDKGQEISIVAAQEDTADEGGASVNAGMYFYWSIQEYNSEGILVYDGDWRSSSETWTVGETMNNESAYGKNGYPYGSGANERADVKYIVLIFRWNNGDLAEGSGMDIPLIARDITDTFPIFYLVFKPFTYTFDCNDGTATVDGSNVSEYKRQRLGISNMKDLVVEPVRDGYTFAGWNLKHSDGGKGKQDGKTYSTDQLNAMFRDGKYWSSLFSYVLFEAQWYPLLEIAYDSNGGMASDGTKTYSHTVKYGEAYNYSSNPFTKNGYVFTGWNTERNGSGTWYNVGDTFINLTAENGGVITLYAQWGVARSFIEYYGNGNTDGSNYIKGYWAINNDKYDDGSAFSKKGHSFDYWSVFSQAGFKLGDKTGNDYIEDVKGITVIKPKNNIGSCVDIAFANYSDYASVGVYPCTSSDNQV